MALGDRVPDVINITSQLEKYAELGYVFMIAHRFESIADNSSVELIFVNPSNSGKKAYIVSIELIAGGETLIDCYKNSTINANGTEITPINKKFGSNIESAMHVEYGGTYTPSGSSMSFLITGGASHFTRMGGENEGLIAGIIEPGNNLHIKLTNKSGTTIKMGIRMVWYEV